MKRDPQYIVVSSFAAMGKPSAPNVVAPLMLAPDDREDLSNPATIDAIADDGVPVVDGLPTNKFRWHEELL
jgi:hypothetical protein